ncbi:alpha/beta fold hydrolase [Limibaculum sp. FT325]|uniref:alpha/beta fold hydrolase n=1 Tax=Thermohalobaculum sediminis TaxID=2939436 RepID=UPI0020BF0605|nr:alpha/beta fold hydrolase [Limibaculum sediminis]MCL5777363.1 alpha/beta fold hydrolase [Limibaculum sediminis]
MRRRDFLAGAGAASLAAGCAAPFPTEDAERDFPPIGMFVEVEGLRIHAWEAGPPGGVPAVLVHGASGNLRDWTFSIAPHIAAGRRVIAFDRPGFGHSDRPEGADAADPAVQAAILRAAAAKLGAGRPVVVGHSWGAALALAWALDAPDRTAGVVSVSGVTMPYSGMARVFEALGISGAITWAYTEYMKSVAEDDGIDRFIDRVFRPQQPPEGYAAYVGGPLALREATLAANSDDISGLNAALRRMAPRYPGLRLPVEIIHGAEDFIDPERHARGLAEVLPEVRLTILEGVGHMAHHAAPGTLATAIARAAGEAEGKTAA